MISTNILSTKTVIKMHADLDISIDPIVNVNTFLSKSNADAE